MSDTMPAKKTGGKTKKQVQMVDAMRAAGFNVKAAQEINDFWKSLGVSGVKIGSTTLTVDEVTPVKPIPKKVKK